MAIEFSIFSVESFQIFKFHENEAKHNKHNFKRGLTLTFEIKSFLNYWKTVLRFFELIRVPLQSLKLQISRLPRATSSLTFRQL